MNDFAVLILSCDRYSDLWRPFVNQLRSCLPVEGYKIYLGSNTIPCSEPGIVSVLSGEDLDWSTSCRRILEQISESKLLIMVEDLFPASKADTRLFNEAIDFFVRSPDVNHIKYWANPPLDSYRNGSNIGVYERGAPYRATVCGFWNRRCLLDMLLDGESPWAFEIMGSYRTSYRDGFYGVKRSIFEFQNLVEKGCWLPQSLEWARTEGIALQFERRPVSAGGRQFLSRIKMAYFAAMLKAPWKKRTALMNKLRKALISY